MGPALSNVFGPNFPFFATIGNHDVFEWDARYVPLMTQRLQRAGVLDNCTGEYGVNMVCNYLGMVFVMSGVGERGVDHAEFVDQAFRQNPAQWKFCLFHRVQQIYQAGGRMFGDDVGWPIYETCREHGAIIVTAHVHHFCRTHQMTNFENAQIGSIVGNQSDPLQPMVIRPGASFAVVSGAGGQGLSPFNDDMELFPHWGAVAAPQIGLRYGALFCTLNIDGVANQGECHFEDFNGREWDSFFIRSDVPPTLPLVPDLRKCDSRKIDRAVSSADDNAIVTAGIFVCGAERLAVSATDSILVRFEDIDLRPKDTILSAHLEFYGATVQSSGVMYGAVGSAATLCEKGENPFAVTASLGSDAVEDAYLGASHTHDVIGVEFPPTPSDEPDLDDEIWTTPDIAEIIRDIISSPSWTDGSSMTFALTGGELSNAASFDVSPCVSPSLVINVGSSC